MGRRCRPQSFGEVQRGNSQQRRLVPFLKIFFYLLEGLVLKPAASATPPQPTVLSIGVVQSLFIRSYLGELNLQSTKRLQTVDRGVEEI